jgi:hypothetical protein
MEKCTSKYFLNYVAFLLMLFFGISSFAQTPEPNELEIKTSGLYVWEELRGSDESSIKKVLADVIWQKNECQEILKTHPELKKTEIKYLVKPRGKNFLIIGYISKSPSNQEAEQKRENVAEQKVETIIVPKNELKVQPKAALDTTIQTSGRLKEQANAVVYKEENRKTEGVEIAKNKEDTISSNLHKQDKRDGEENKISQGELPAREKQVVQYQNKGNEVESSNHTAISSAIVGIDKCLDVMEFLKQEKKKGKVFYDSKESSFDAGIANCLVMFCDINTGKIAYLLAKGNTERLDYLSGKELSLTQLNQNQNIKKLFIYEIK